jgi:hypothetical protein
MGGKSSGVSESVQQGELANSTALTQIAEQQASNANQLYQLTEPGLQQSEDFYQTLAAGNPNAIMKAIAPTAQAANESAAGARSNIMANSPAGGEKNLALEATDVNRGSTIAKTISSATTGSYDKLGQLAGQGVGESISAAGTGIQGLGTANQGLSALGQQQLESQQINAQEKGNMLGAVTGLGGSVTKAAADAGSFSDLFS